MDLERDLDPRKAVRPAESPALWPAVGLLAGTQAAACLSEPPYALSALLLALGLALARPSGLVVAALALGLINAAYRAAAEPPAAPRRPVEVVAIVSGHPTTQGDRVLFRSRARSWRCGRAVKRVSFDLQVTMPADSAPPPIGTVVRLRGYLKRSPGFANIAPIEPGSWRLHLKSDRFLSVDAPAGGWLAGAGRLRRGVEARLAPFESSSRGAALVRALLLGDRSELPKQWRQALNRSGLAHLLAVSGLHVGLLAIVLSFAGVVMPRRLRFLPAAAGLVIYLLLVGPRPPVLRASAMGLLAIVAIWLDRPPRALNALAGCAAALVLLDPPIVARLGFQLSFAATAGILVLMPLYAERWAALPLALRRSLATTSAAQVATLPWIAPLAGGLHPLAPVLNLVAIPLLVVALLLSFLWLGAAWGFPPLARVTLPVLDAATWPLEALASLPPGPGFLLPVALTRWGAGVLAVAFLGLGLWPRRAFRVAVLLALAVQTGARPAAPGEVEMVMFDVGQGEAVLLRDGPFAVLVDGGGWRHGDLGGRLLVPSLAALGVRRLDAVVLTHPDLDHCGGLVDLTRYLPVGEVWMGPGWVDDRCAAELLAAPAARWRVLWQGEVETLGRWRLEVLHPPAGLRRGRNDRSLVLSASVLGHGVLLTGDIEAATERNLARDRRRRGDRAPVDILKVAHHGSKTSTVERFLRVIDPRLALISSGLRNPCRHPHPATLERLRAAGVRVLRTDRSGMLRLRLRRGRWACELPGAPRAISEN